MGNFHFLNWVRLVVFMFFETTAEQRDTDKNEERREAVGFLERDVAHGDFSMATLADREVF